MSELCQCPDTCKKWDLNDCYLFSIKSLYNIDEYFFFWVLKEKSWGNTDTLQKVI